jgi:hypothetical protein
LRNASLSDRDLGAGAHPPVTPRLRARRGSALILVLLMTLAVAALAVAAVFMSSSAGLLSRFYDRERDHRYAAESALEMVRSRLERDADFAVSPVGVTQLAAGLRIPDADGSTASDISVNVYAAVTGDTAGGAIPTVTLLAAAYDSRGTRHVRRMDLRRRSFSSYQLFVDTFPTGATFGPGKLSGRAHANSVWRSAASAANAPVFADTVTAVGGFAGVGTFLADSVSGVSPVAYPRDSTFAWMTGIASAANLTIAPVSIAGGAVSGSRVEFVAFDANGDGAVTPSEGFLRVFDLRAHQDTTFLRLGPASFAWNSGIVQNQCGAFYYRNLRWHFIPVATHRQSWFNNPTDGLLEGTGASNYPMVPPGQRADYIGYDYATTQRILSWPTARCFPAGSPFLMPAERFTNNVCVQTGTGADIFPFGAAPTGCFPAGKYGGKDTTFTASVRRCAYDASGTCIATDSLGSWRSFPGGNAASGIPSTVRQANELPRLWPLAAPRNANARGLVRVTGGPIFISGTVAGQVTVMVDGRAEIIDQLTYAGRPAPTDTDACPDQLGLIATGDILVADNAITRGRSITSASTSFSRHLGSIPSMSVHGHLMSLTGTVGVANPSGAGLAPQACAQVSASNSSGGCWYLVGSAAMARFSPPSGGTNAGLHWAGSPTRCMAANRRPPFFPLASSYTPVRTLEVAPAQANTPAKITALLMRLKGKAL